MIQIWFYRWQTDNSIVLTGICFGAWLYFSILVSNRDRWVYSKFVPHIRWLLLHPVETSAFPFLRSATVFFSILVLYTMTTGTFTTATVNRYKIIYSWVLNHTWHGVRSLKDTSLYDVLNLVLNLCGYMVIAVQNDQTPALLKFLWRGWRPPRSE